MNVGNPQLAFDFAQLPNAGVGLARLEFVINNEIGVHPRRCLEYAELPGELRAQVEAAARGYPSPRAFFVEKLVEGVATIAAAFWPKPVIVRLSDFKSNEYRKLLGGERYEPEEENPMLGFRGASRYLAASFRDCFELECEALRKVRDELGLTNVELMVPFVRTRGRGAPRHRAAGAERPAARRERPAHRHDVRAALERAARRRSSSSISTASRSAPTTSPSSPSASTATPGWWRRRSTSATRR